MTARSSRVDQECVEAYIYLQRPLRILLLRRPPSRGRIWVPVSGKVERSDSTLSAAVRREVAEETGFERPRRVAPLHWTFRFRGPSGGRWRLHAFGVELIRSAVPRLSAEHDAFAWLDPPTALQRLHYPDNRSALRRLLRGRAHRRFPSHPRNP